MATVDNSALTSPAFASISADGNTAWAVVIVTPPSWARSVDVSNPDGAVRISSVAHTSEGNVATEYFPVPSAAGTTVELQTDETGHAAQPFAIGFASTSHTGGLQYRQSKAR